MKIKQLIISATLTFFNTADYADCILPISMGVSKETYVINSDASDIQTSESYKNWNV